MSDSVTERLVIARDAIDKALLAREKSKYTEAIGHIEKAEENLDAAREMTDRMRRNVQ